MCMVVQLVACERLLNQIKPNGLTVSYRSQFAAYCARNGEAQLPRAPMPAGHQRFGFAKKLAVKDQSPVAP